MISQQEIYNKLSEIAVAHNLEGDSIEVQKDWLAYLFYTQGVEVLNAIKESNLSTASLMNSKIIQCMQCMYSVYRGHNVKLRLVDYVSNTILNKDKYELVYKSNNFYIYTNEATNIVQSSEGQSPTPFDCIISRKEKYMNTITVSERNRYFIDFEIRDRILSNLSEDVRIKINGEEVKITRMFYDHINQKSNYSEQDLITLMEGGELNVDNEFKLFLLTIPDYGVRVYKKGYFKLGDQVTFECFDYCTKSDLMDNFGSEVNRIKFNGFDMIVTGNSTDPTVNRLISEVPRDNVNSILYNAIAYQHVQSQIMSNADVDILFTEYFRDYVRSSSHLAVQMEDGTWRVVIYYIPIESDTVLENEVIQEFSRLYGNYYITDNIIAIPAIKIELPVKISINITESIELLSQISTIFAPYENKLPNLIECDINGSVLKSESIMDHKLIRAQITNLSSVKYITAYDVEEQLVEPITDGGVRINYPTYYVFDYQISYQLV